MRRVLGYAMIWCGATALAISLAWFGVRDVLRAEVTDEPYPGVAVAAARTGRPPAPPDATSAAAPPTSTPAASTSANTTAPSATPSAAPARRTSRPSAAPATSTGPSTRPTVTELPATAARATPSRRPTASRTPAKPPASKAPSPTPTSSARQGSSQVKVVTVKGGQVSFAIENNECRLLSASPAAGYEAKVSGNVGWIRVDLLKGEHGSTVFCTWHGHGPATDVWEF